MSDSSSPIPHEAAHRRPSPLFLRWTLASVLLALVVYVGSFYLIRSLPWLDESPAVQSIYSAVFQPLRYLTATSDRPAFMGRLALTGVAQGEFVDTGRDGLGGFARFRVQPDGDTKFRWPSGRNASTSDGVFPSSDGISSEYDNATHLFYHSSPVAIRWRARLYRLRTDDGWKDVVLPVVTRVTSQAGH